MRRILVSASGVAFYWLGARIPTPSVDHDVYRQLLEPSSDERALPLSLAGASAPTVFGLGVIPLLTAMLVLGLGARIIPGINDLSRGGPAGRLRYLQVTRRLAVALAAVGAVTSATATVRGKTNQFGLPLSVLHEGIMFSIAHVLVLVAGFLVLLALAELLTRHGIGNGVMVLTVASVLGHALPALGNLFSESHLAIILYVAAMSTSTVLLVFAVCSKHQIPLFSIFPSGTAGIPNAGVINTKVSGGSAGPILFASSTLSVIAITANALPSDWVGSGFIDEFSNSSSMVSLATFGLLTVAFARIYGSVTSDPVKEANELARSGRFIRGSAPGLPTAKHLNAVSTATSWAYAAVLTPVMALPLVMTALGAPTTLLGGAVVIPVLVLSEIVAQNSKIVAQSLSQRNR